MTASLARETLSRIFHQLDGATFRELGQIADRCTSRPKIADPVRTANKLAEILSNGGLPTLGWWRRQYQPPTISDES